MLSDCVFKTFHFCTYEILVTHPMKGPGMGCHYSTGPRMPREIKPCLHQISERQSWNQNQVLQLLVPDHSQHSLSLHRSPLQGVVLCQLPGGEASGAASVLGIQGSTMDHLASKSGTCWEKAPGETEGEAVTKPRTGAQQIHVLILLGFGFS